MPDTDHNNGGTDDHNDIRPHHHKQHIHFDADNDHDVVVLDYDLLVIDDPCALDDCVRDDIVYVLTVDEYRALVDNQCPQPAIHYPARYTDVLDNAWLDPTPEDWQ